MKKRIAVILIIILISPILYWGISLAKCEILTIMHGHHFTEEHIASADIGDVDFLKVLSYSKNKATVYYVSDSKTFGTIHTFTKEKGEWQYDNWYWAMWTANGGNASEMVWPYLWHFLYPALYAERTQSTQ